MESFSAAVGLFDPVYPQKSLTYPHRMWTNPTRLHVPIEIGGGCSPKASRNPGREVRSPRRRWMKQMDHEPNLDMSGDADDIERALLSAVQRTRTEYNKARRGDFENCRAAYADALMALNRYMGAS
jgi:hypothetical protein